jgi:hypothetical protein
MPTKMVASFVVRGRRIFLDTEALIKVNATPA